MNRLQPAHARRFDIVGEVVEEDDARGRLADRTHDMVEPRCVRLPVADRGGVIELTDGFSVCAWTCVKWAICGRLVLE